MKLPDDVFYTKDHEWLRLEDDGVTGTVGVTEFAQRELGDIVFVELEPEGTDLSSEDVFGTIEAVKTVSELFSPVDGVIAEVNGNLEDSPESVNNDPYGDGWMVKITLSDPAQLEGLLSAADYGELINA